MTKRIIFILLMLALCSCVGTEVTGAVVDKHDRGTAYGLDVLNSDGSVSSIRVTFFVWNDVRLAHVYRFYCDQNGPFCRAQSMPYTAEWSEIVDDYIADHK